MLKRILGLPISKQALETAAQEDVVDVETFYRQKAPPSPETEGSILVIQADGKGVPMVQKPYRFGFSAEMLRKAITYITYPVLMAVVVLCLVAVSQAAAGNIDAVDIASGVATQVGLASPPATAG